MTRKRNNNIALGRQVAVALRQKIVDNDSQNLEPSSVDDFLETNINNSFKRRRRSVLTNSEKLNESQQDININDETHFNLRSSSCSNAALLRSYHSFIQHTEYFNLLPSKST